MKKEYCLIIICCLLFCFSCKENNSKKGKLEYQDNNNKVSIKYLIGVGNTIEEKKQYKTNSYIQLNISLPDGKEIKSDVDKGSVSGAGLQQFSFEMQDAAFAVTSLGDTLEVAMQTTPRTYGIDHQASTTFVFANTAAKPWEWLEFHFIDPGFQIGNHKARFYRKDIEEAVKQPSII